MSNPSSLENKNSRYVQGGKTTRKKKSVGWWERDVSINEKRDDDIVIDALPAVYSGRPDLLSYDLYASNNLEWVILQYNNLVDINEEFVTGKRIVAPSRSRVFSGILTKTISYGENDV